MRTLRVLRYSFASALADLAAIYTWRTWVFGWLLRVLFQVSFFALVGTVLGDAATTRYLFIGAAVVIVVLECTSTVASTVWERQAGTLPLLIAAPTSPFVVFAGRSVQWIISGVACASIALFGLAPVFGAPVTVRSLWALPVLVVTAISGYTFSLAVAGMVMRAPGVRNVVSTVLWWVLGLVAGVQVPVSYWPRWVRMIGTILPLGHGLSAIRGLFGEGIGPGQSTTGRVLIRETGWECLVALGWLGVAALVFRWATTGGRHSGSIEFGD